jgi:hypothetical protein
MLMDQTTENNSGGGGAAPATSTTIPATQTEGISDSASLDQMYKTPVEEKVEPEKQPTQEGKPDEVSASGYGKPVEEAKLPVDAKVTPEVVVPPADAEPKVEFNSEGLNDDGKKVVEAFAKTHKLTKEVTQAFADQLKLQVKSIADIQTAQAQAAADNKKAVQAGWEDELKNDKDFGGENFKANIKRVDTVLEKLFPHTKNLLTTNKSMLPPSIMKDFLTVHKLMLSGESNIVNGQNGSVDSNDTGAFLNSFYKD